MSGDGEIRINEGNDHNKWQHHGHDEKEIVLNVRCIRHREHSVLEIRGSSCCFFSDDVVQQKLHFDQSVVAIFLCTDFIENVKELVISIFLCIDCPSRYTTRSREQLQNHLTAYPS